MTVHASTFNHVHGVARIGDDSMLKDTKFTTLSEVRETIFTAGLHFINNNTYLRMRVTTLVVTLVLLGFLQNIFACKSVNLAVDPIDRSNFSSFITS